MKTVKLIKVMPAIAIALMILNSSENLQAQVKNDFPLPLLKGGPFDLVYFPENMPDKNDVSFYPHEWVQSYGNAQHNAAFTIAKDAPDWMAKGVSWQFAEARSWPLSEEKAFGESAYGVKGSLTTITQSYGNALGVSVVDGIVYAESDDNFIYAINAKTGKLIWRTSPVGNTFMGTPVVVGDLVYVTPGSVGFNFTNVQDYKKTGMAIRGGDISYNGVFALNKNTGELVWYYLTNGGTMPTPAFGEDRIFFSAGDGTVYALDAKTGKEIWKNEVGGMANMSSPAYYDGKVYAAMSLKAFIYCFDAKAGKVLWQGTVPNAENTGMGDVSPAVDDGVVVMDAVSMIKTKSGKDTMNTGLRAYDANTGKVLWTQLMGEGPKPPAFKGGMPMIHDNVVYVGTPVNSVYQAYELKTGKLLWTWHVPDAGPAGAGRGPATFYEGVLYMSTGPSVFAVDPKDGKLIGQKHIGGRFGIVNPAIVGGTIYLGNSWDWVIALPVSEVNPNYHP
ncbi:MAG: PQQ-binding-like beta-propeller repeat protein [Bacteroidales bacterium]